jgi:hypothetical protein
MICNIQQYNILQGIKVVGVEDELNPFSKETIAKNPAEAWKKTTERRENRVPKGERKYGAKCDSLDACGYYSAKSPDAGMLALKLPKVSMNQSTYQSIYLSIYLSIYISIYPSLI